MEHVSHSFLQRLRCRIIQSWLLVTEKLFILYSIVRNDARPLHEYLSTSSATTRLGECPGETPKVRSLQRVLLTSPECQNLVSSPQRTVVPCDRQDHVGSSFEKVSPLRAKFTRRPYNNAGINSQTLHLERGQSCKTSIWQLNEGSRLLHLYAFARCICSCASRRMCKTIIKTTIHSCGDLTLWT
jgi:hypothetical protein